MKLLSVIVPFFNSENKCFRLLENLKVCSYDNVEVICIDDGSVDSTLKVLEEFKGSASCDVKIIHQTNKGPGGARNAGLEISNGEYVWFVDSDDNVDLDLALNFLKSLTVSYDAIDFNVYSRGEAINSMCLSFGEYDEGDLTFTLLSRFGHICSKIFHRRVFVDNGIRYPEYCIYEDNPLQFILPFFIRSFYKSDCVAYFHHVDNDSITRGKKKGSSADRYFDRLLTTAWGYDQGLILSGGEKKYVNVMRYHYVRLCVFKSRGLSKIPSAVWIEKARVMKKFRQDLVRIGDEFAAVPFVLKEESTKKYKFALLLIWLLSYFFPSQDSFFLEKRKSAWGKLFEAPDISLRKI